MDDPELAWGETSEDDRVTHFRFPKGVGLFGLHNSVPGRAIILLAVCNIVWWFVAWDTISYQVDEEGVALASLACLGASLLLLGYIYIAGHARPPRWVYLLILVSGLIVPFALSATLVRYAEDLAPALLSWPLFALLYGPLLYRWPSKRSVMNAELTKPIHRPSAWSYVGAWVLAGVIAGVLGTFAALVVMSSAEPPRMRSEWVEYWTPFFALSIALATVGGILSQTLVYGLFKRLRPSPVIPWMLALGLLGVGYSYLETETTLLSNGWSADNASAMAGISSGCAFLGLVIQVVAFWFIFRHRENL